ncbi:hypothetical protein ABFS82_02G146300 [Erythranthe guttata]|uniref:C2H2-type domain-containing protein n=1 Tax=Erythranthe guttata TaxID=4155 RepID=A0A022QVR4_ERYGU|nr:hypothetical protein MIMGU_mgv1a017686mg [Erythranthe guttata]
MAGCVDEPSFKHYCRVCKKGFMCGRALGGHMRAHGIGDESGGNLDDDDTLSDWDGHHKFGGGGGDVRSNNSNKKMYQLRTNPNRLKSCRTCENCGKEFLSWKSFLEHGKCSSDDASDSLVSSPEEYSGDDGGRRGGGGWSKRKRSLRSKVDNNSNCISSPSEDEDLLMARCLVQLANTTVEPPPPAAAAAEPEESCASASREEERRNPRTAYFAPPPKNIRAAAAATTSFDHQQKAAKGLFECKACKKVFNSHQALGGHRASHKKVKGCYAARQDQITDEQNNNNNNNGGGGATLLRPPQPEDDVITNEEMFAPSKFEQGGGGHHPPPPAALVGAARRKSKVHECSICHRVFNSGQALGGHKRCHWITSNISPADTTTSNSLPKFHFQDNADPIIHGGNNTNNKFKADVSDKLDLNVPAWAHVSGVRRDPRNPLSFEVSTDMQLQVVGEQLIKKDENNNKSINLSKNKVKNETTKYEDDDEDEADSKLKFAKLSDLKEMETSGSSSQWLQVGIGSTTEAAAAVVGGGGSGCGGGGGGA